MKPIKISALDSEQLDALEDLYRTTRDARLRTRAQMTLLAAEQRLTAAKIAELPEALLEKHPTGRVYVAWDNSYTHEDDELEEVLRGAAGPRGA